MKSDEDLVKPIVGGGGRLGVASYSILLICITLPDGRISGVSEEHISPFTGACRIVYPVYIPRSVFCDRLLVSHHLVLV